MSSNVSPLAVVTGASSGIGYELARCCAQNGFDLVIAADEPEIQTAANVLATSATRVEPVNADSLPARALTPCVLLSVRALWQPYLPTRGEASGVLSSTRISLTFVA